MFFTDRITLLKKGSWIWKSLLELSEMIIGAIKEGGGGANTTTTFDLFLEKVLVAQEKSCL